MNFLIWVTAHLHDMDVARFSRIDHYEHYGRTQDIAQYVLHLSWSFLQAALLCFNRHGKSGRETKSTEQSGPGEIP
jgi:hypothetical protein